MHADRRSHPLTVKFWSRAGLVLTDWCNAACECCYLACGPGRDGRMSIDQALVIWEQLQAASPIGCRVHLTGGEPFGPGEADWQRLLEIARRARQAGLGPLESVETNAFWATDEAICRARLRALDEAGMGQIKISADPFHQRFVPIDRPRRLAAEAERTLRSNRVKVRWADWLADGEDLTAAPPDRIRRVQATWLQRGRERLTGRAGDLLAGAVGSISEAGMDRPCRESLLRGKHVHVLPGGEVMPGTCAGLILGRLGKGLPSAGQLHADLADHWKNRPVLAALVRRGPAGLAELATLVGVPSGAPSPAGRCATCWSLRRALHRAGGFPEEIGPAGLFDVLDTVAAGA